MNDEEYIQRIEGFIAHHGTKGMHWGIRKDDKTSNKTSSVVLGKNVSSSKSIRREKRAVKRDVLAEKYNVKISEIKAKPETIRFIQKHRESQIAELNKMRDQKLDDAQRIRAGKLTKGQKKLAIGASVAAALLISYGAYKYTDSGAFHQQKIKGKEFITGEKHSWKKKESLANAKYVDDIVQNVVKPINPGYGKFGTKMNCRRCTFAYEMRRRGNDVNATLTNAGTGQTPAGLLNAIDPKNHYSTGKIGMMKALYEDQKSGNNNELSDSLKNYPLGKHNIELPNTNPLDFTKRMRLLSEPDTSETIYKSLSSQPNGARGELGVTWSMGGGHSMAWEIIGGKPHVFDTQNGKVYSSAETFSRIGDSVASAGFTRLDNVKLNDDFLRRWLRDA